MHATGRPPGYPSDLERHLVLRDGRGVDVRPIVPEDAAELAESIRTADADTLYRRFLGGAPPLTPRLLEYLTVLDYRTRLALVARDPVTGRGLAVARYDVIGPGTAEVAVAVRPDWRRAGLATALLRVLGEGALRQGIHTFTAYALAGNRPVSALIAEAGGSSIIKEGIAELEVSLAGEASGAGPGTPGPAGAAP